MKLGSLVGIVISGILIVAGIIMCIIGSVSAKNSEQDLFMQVDDSGTHYIQNISSEVTKLQLDYKNANITVKGGAERSQIEFINFNPNLYSISVTANVITFDEVADFTSMMDLGDYGFSFKGLRYALDPRNDDFDDLQKSIVINLAPESNLKIIDIGADESSVKIENLSIAGDMLLNVGRGTIEIVEASSESTISITSEEITASIEGVTSNVFRFSGGMTELNIKECQFNDTDINADSGRIDYYSSVTLDDCQINVTTETGGLLFNSKPIKSPMINEPATGEDPDAVIKKFKIKGVSAGINLEFPSQISTDTTPNTAENGVKQ